MFVSPPPITKVDSLSQSIISSLDSGSFDRNRADGNIKQPTTSEVANTEIVMAYNEDIDPPPPHDISNVFAAADFLSQSSYDSVKYKRAWHRAKGIRFSSLSSGESADASSREFSIALNQKDIASIMAATGIIFPKQYANIITRHEQNKIILSHSTSVGNKRKQTKDRNLFSYPILCPLCHLHQRKQIKMKLMKFRIYFNVVYQVHIVNKKSF